MKNNVVKFRATSKICIRPLLKSSFLSWAEFEGRKYFSFHRKYLISHISLHKVKTTFCVDF